LDLLLITPDLGGKTNHQLELPFIEKYRVIRGEEIVHRFAHEVDYLEFARIFDRAETIEKLASGYQVTTAGGEIYRARTLIVTTGAESPTLDVPGEKEYRMRGLCYSAVSYAHLFIERPTCVIGDTERALRATVELAHIARKVTLVAPGRGELDSPLGARVLATPNVAVLQGFQIQAVRGDEYARRLVLRKEEDEREVEADVFFVELELIPRSNLLAGLVARDERGRIIVDACNRTSAEGIFAAGDVTDVFAEQVLIAVGEGAKAALAAYEYLLTREE
jgi:thioredoxin reductase